MMKRTKIPKPIRQEYKQKKIKVFLQSQAIFKIDKFEDEVNEWLEGKNIEILNMHFTAAENVMYGFIYYQEL